MAKIKKIRCIRTRSNASWVIVKVETDQPGLYGIGSASDMYNPGAVTKIIEELYAPLLTGRDASHIEDLWQMMYTNGYWRNGPLSNTALGGIDVALWDIKGKEAGMPLYKLLGGPCRSAVPCYAHAFGKDFEALIEDISRYVEEGFPVIRCQLGHYGGGGFLDKEKARMPKNAWDMKQPFDEETYLNNIPDMFEKLRVKFGKDLKFTHDVHEHLSPSSAVALSKLLEPYRLFFLEDVLPPEQIHWYRHIKQQCTTPQAIGELFAHPHEWRLLIQERLIDFIRTRISKAGGISAARKIVIFAEAYGVRTAWQEGGDNDPVNLAAAMHLDLCSWNFGIQEENHFRPEEIEAFPGCPIVQGGYLYTNDLPGLGIDIDEEKAALLLGDPQKLVNYHRPYGTDRKADGTIVRP